MSCGPDGGEQVGASSSASGAAVAVMGLRPTLQGISAICHLP